MLRIVSLIASSTEIVHALGLGRYMVGRSHECDYPLEVKKLPICTEPRFSTAGSSREIHRDVRNIVEKALSVYQVNSEKLANLKPTHIITQTQCEVCAVSLRDVEAALCQLISSRPKIISLQPNSLKDIWNDIKTVGIALGAEREAHHLVMCLHEQMAEIAGKVRHSWRPTVAFVDWIEPLIVAGNWIPELIEMAGGKDVFACAQASVRTSWLELLRKDPNIVIVSPCGFDMPRGLSELTAFFQSTGKSCRKAVCSKKVFVVDGNQYMNRPGPRILESLEILAEILHPTLFHFGHYGSSWAGYQDAACDKV